MTIQFDIRDKETGAVYSWGTFRAKTKQGGWTFILPDIGQVKQSRIEIITEPAPTDHALIITKAAELATSMLCHDLANKLYELRDSLTTPTERED